MFHLAGKASALVVSASAHAALALAFLRAGSHAPVARLNPALPQVVALDLDLEPLSERIDPRLDSASDPAAKVYHRHAYPVPPGHDRTPHDVSIRHREPLLDAGKLQLAAAPSVPDIAAAPTPPRFVLSAGFASRARSGESASRGVGQMAQGNAVFEVVPEAQVDQPARLLSGTPPRYSAEAETAGVEASVPLEIVVDSSGAVSSARVLSHVGYGLDEAALRGVRGYRFVPARRADQAQAVRMRWVIRFQLR